MSNANILNIDAFPEDLTVRVTQCPRCADILFRSGDKLHNFRFDDPQPLTAVVMIFDGCCNIRVIDLNLQNNGCLEFGRYRVQVWSEDDPISEFVVDKFEYWTDAIEQREDP